MPNYISDNTGYEVDSIIDSFNHFRKTILVHCPSGSTVTVSNGQETYTKLSTTTELVFNPKAYDVYDITCLYNGITQTESLDIDKVKIYEVLFSKIDSGCIVFSSINPFTLGVTNAKWNGTVEYSTDGTTWTTWSGASAISSNSGNELYLRGVGNTSFYDVSNNIATTFVLTSPTNTEISCTGNIETLLDYPTVANGQHPQMANFCFDSLFRNCTLLLTAPELPATTLTNGCYQWMFAGCTSLVFVPTLPAMTLTSNCYRQMFSNCTSLKIPAELPATAMVAGCYNYMFSGCTSIKLSETQTSEYTQPYRIPSEGTGVDTATNALLGMFNSTGGTFTGTPTINTTYYLWDPVDTNFLTFSSENPFTLGVERGTHGGANWNGTIEYSTDKVTWTTWDASSALSSNSENELYLRGTGNTSFYDTPSNKYTTFVLASSTNSGVSCTGNIETLLDYQTVANGQHPQMGRYCFSKLFQDCTLLTIAPELPATTLADYCYMEMFSCCTSLTTAPTLPATTLVDDCYGGMFVVCTSLKLSKTQTAEYTTPYRIPSEGTGVDATNALTNMFASTGGTFTGTPEINTTYYLDVSGT